MEVQHRLLHSPDGLGMRGWDEIECEALPGITNLLIVEVGAAQA